MFDNQNPALARASSAKIKRRFWAPPNLETPEGAREAARSAWWGGAWLAVSFLLDAGLSVARFDQQPDLLWIALAIDGVGICIGGGLAWLIRKSQPLWALVVLLVALVISCAAALLTLHIGLGLVINAVLIYVTITAIRGRLRLGAFRRGDLTPAQTGKVFE
jgi:hypothetical protein